MRWFTPLPLLLLTACRADGTVPVSPGDVGDTAVGPDPYDVPVGPYEATIRWTSYGIPHIGGADYGSVGFGMGYAHARDHVCTVLDMVVMVRSERARWHGAGDDEAHVLSDVGWRALRVRADAEAAWFDLPEDRRAGIVGYAAGVNRYVEDVGVDGLPAPCAGADWVGPIDHIDLYSYYLALSLNGSGAVWLESIALASPPGSAEARPAPPESDLEVFRDLPLGSNGWAIGSERSASGGGLLLSNTHFPSVGERTWHESHLTIPGELDVYGASLAGVPVINIGFNRDVAWTHTVSFAPRFVGYKLTLDPEEPTRYLYDGEYLSMEETVHDIEVLQTDGSLETVSRSTWRSIHGLVIDAPVVGWSDIMVIAFKDVNEGNHHLVDVWTDMNRATSLAEFQAAHSDHPGIPWVHTMAVSADGTAWYADTSRVPSWSDETAAAWEQYTEDDAIAGLFADYGVFLVDGADPIYEWTDAGGLAPGLVPAADAPQVERDDFVFNANDNHWMPNPDALLEGYSVIYGDERSPRSARTRMNAVYLTETGEGSPSGADGVFDLDEVEEAALSGRGMIAELLKDEVVAVCEAEPVVTVNEVEHDLTEACEVLAAWDGRSVVDSVGVGLWREFLGSGQYSEFRDAGGLFAEPFDADDPVATPHSLMVEADADVLRVQRALVQAVANMEAAGQALDTPLGDMQFMRKGDVAYPVPGGTDLEGNIAIVRWGDGNSETTFQEMERAEVVNSTTDLMADGYQMNGGNSWVMAVDLGGETPEARAILTYSQSQDPMSQHYADQTVRYGAEGMRPILFEEDDILADPEMVELVLTHD